MGYDDESKLLIMLSMELDPLHFCMGFALINICTLCDRRVVKCYRKRRQDDSIELRNSGSQLG